MAREAGVRERHVMTRGTSAEPGSVVRCVAWLATAFLSLIPGAAGASGDVRPVTHEIFVNEVIQFRQEPADTTSVAATTAENGRVILRTVEIDPPDGASRVVARVATRPVPRDDVSVHDPWDRAGNVRLAIPGAPDLELIKFVTAYGGATEHVVDVTHLAPVLRGTCTFKGFVDTWVSPAWTMDFSLTFESGGCDTTRTALWVTPVLYEESATAVSLGDTGLAIPVVVPRGADRVVLFYFASGHCTDGTDEDEFVSKDNVISIDGVVVERYKPWRDDCRDLRAINPYTRRWSNGAWSSDYDRSGWCPGDDVPPVLLDLSDHMTPGRHVVGFNVEDVRPRGEDGHHGYWRMSAYLVGWKED